MSIHPFGMTSEEATMILTQEELTQIGKDHANYLANGLFNQVERSPSLHQPSMPNWEHCWRKGFEPQLSLLQLIALRNAIQNDDPNLLQEQTTNPPPLLSCADQKCCGGCAIAFCGMSEGKETVGEVEEFFAQTCYQCDQLLGEMVACRYFLNFWDENTMDAIKAKFLPVLEENIEARKAA